MPSETVRVHLALLVVQFSFASGAFVGKWALNGEAIDASAIAFTRAAAGALAFQAVRVLTTDRAAPRPSARDHGGFVALAILGVIVNQAFFLHGLQRSTATATILLAATIPVFTAAVAGVVGAERFHPLTIAGVAVASVGVVTMTGVRDVSLGNLLVTVNSFSYACYLVAARRPLQRFGAPTTVAWVFTYGALGLATIGLAPLVRQAPLWTSRGVLLMLWFIAVPTVLAYLLNAWALSRAKASLVAGYVYLQPFMVAVLAWPLLGERVGARVWVAGAAILAGVALIAVRPRQREPL